MLIDINRYDHAEDRPSLRLSFSAHNQTYNVHRDFHGPYDTLVRILVLRVSERDLRASNLARRCMEELQALGTTYGGGYVRIRHNDSAKVLLARIAELCAGVNDPTPDRPIMPDHDAMVPASTMQVVPQSSIDQFVASQLGRPYSTMSFDDRVAARDRAGR